MEVEEKGGERNDTTSHSGRLVKSSSSYENSSFLNDHAKKSSSFIAEVLEGGILVQPKGGSLLQSGHVNGAVKEGKLPEICLENCASKKSTSEKTQDTHRQIKPSVGRVARSRSSSQQTSGINKSLEWGTSAFCSSEEGGGPPPSVSHLMDELNASSKLLDAAKISQAHSGRTGETQVVLNSEGILKSVNSSNITAVPVTRSTSGCIKESQLGANHHENAENVAGSAHIEAPGIKQPISSCIKLNEFKIFHALSDRIEETKAVCSSEGVHKPVISSNIVAPGVTRSKCGSMKESLLGDNHQEKAEMVVGNVPTEVAVVMEPVSADIKLDPITLCTESEGLASLQASDCCMIFKPKQLNFDDIDEYALDEFCSPLSKKRKLDGYSGQECHPSNESASSIDHRSGSTLFESQLPNANFMSSSLKAGRTDSHNIKESTKDVTMNNGLVNEKSVEDAECNSFVDDDDLDVIFEVNKSSKESSNIFEEEKHSEKSHLNEDHASLSKMQIEEGDLGHKGEGSTIGVYIPVSKSSESSLMTKQGNKDFEDPNISKSKELEVGISPLLPIVKLTSGKVNTWPLNHQGDIEDQPYCYSDSQGFRIHIHRDAIHCDLKTPNNNLHPVMESAQVRSSEEIYVSQSDGIQSCDKIIHDGMTSDLPEETRSLHELDAEETFTKVDVEITEMDNVLEQSEPASVSKLIKPAADDSTYSLLADVEPANPTSLIDVTVIDNKDDKILLPEWVTSSGSDCLSQNDDKSVIVSDDFNYSLAAGMQPEIPTNIDEFPVRDYKNFEISLSEWVPSYRSVRSSKNDDKSVIALDESMPVYEGFIIDEEVENVSLESTEGELDFHMLEDPSTTIARASIMEQICRSASMETPLSHFSSTLKENKPQNFYGFMTDGILEQMDLESSKSLDKDCTKCPQKSESDITEVDSSLQNQQKFDSFPFTSTPFSWQSKNHHSSPLGKLWDRSASSSGSSEKQLSSNPELTCFPIEEDPGSNEESENAEYLSDELEENKSLKVENEPESELHTESTEACFQPSIEISSEMVTEGRENDDEEVAADKELPPEATEVCPQHANILSTFMKYRDRCGSNSVNIEASVPKTRDMAKYKPKDYPDIRISRYEDNRGSSIATRASSRGNVSALSKNKSSMRNGIPRISQKGNKYNNIVSNITSFIPIVQQKQSAAICKEGKRDINVKALERAKALKEREQEKENARKAKKEASKLELERIKKENAREMEMKRKKKEEEEKERKADLAARKRQREEDEKKHLAKKRKVVTESQKNQKVPYENSRAGKVVLEKQQAKTASIAVNKKGSYNSSQNKKTDVISEQGKLGTEKTLASVIPQVVSVPEKCDASIDLCEKATSVHEMSPVQAGIVKLTGQEMSYDISPYQCSDDEDEEEEDVPNNKFVPSWASRDRVTMVLPLQQNIVPETIFPVEGFCHMDEVLLPRRLQAR
uniref:transcriptional regulator ATRX n=1 Tax=Erigeron canadensis TaxID=72917 RepID=UPI001CB8C3B1|nr:transcriptional regulator ATRX [Erigeron canadensis]